MTTAKRFFNVFLSFVMAITFAFPMGWTSKAYASEGDATPASANLGASAADDPVVGSLKIVARFNDSMSFYDGHTYLVFTSYQDGITFPCDSSTNYAAYSIDDSYYTDITEDLGNGSWRTGADPDQYFTLMEQSELPGEMTVNKGEVITIGNYRDFNMSVMEAALGAITNSTIWKELSGKTKLAVTNKTLSLMSSSEPVSEEMMVQELGDTLGTNDISVIKGLFDGKVAGGICYNRELYNQKLEWDQFENVTYEVDIRQSQLDNLQSAMAEHNFFSLFENSCATVAVDLWNAALGEDSAYALSANGSGLFFFIQEPKFVRQNIESTLVGYMTNKLDSVEEEDAAAVTDGVTYYVTAPSEVKSYDEDMVSVACYSAENGSLSFVDAEGNEYQSGDLVKKGTELTIVPTCDYGYLLDSVKANGKALTGLTFTADEDTSIDATFCKSTLILNKTGITMGVEDVDQLTATVRHTVDTDNAGFGDVVFESSDPDIVSVDENGSIEALKAGVATIKVSAKYGNGVFDRCYVIVQDEASLQDTVGKLMVVGRYSTEALLEDMDFGHGFFQFTSDEDGLSIDVSNIMWLYQPTDAYYEAVNTYDGEGIDPVTYHNETTDADTLFTQITDMSTLGYTYTVNKGEIFTMGNSTNFISSAKCALEAVLKGDVADILKKHGKYAAMSTLYNLVLTGELSFSSFKESLNACLAELNYDMESGFNPFNGVVDEGATMINREMYRQAVDHDQYPNTSYEIEITRNQLTALMAYMNDHSYYSVLDNNCAGVIAKAWNVVVSGDESLQVDAGINGSLSSPSKLQSEITRIASGREGYSDDHNVFKAEKTNFVAYDDTQYVVLNGNEVVAPYELVEPDTLLSVYCVNDEGGLDTAKYVESVIVNGVETAGNTFTMGTLRANLTCKVGYNDAITSQPESVTANRDDVVEMSVETTGKVATYQWQHSKDGVRWNNTKWAGYDTDTLSFKMLAALDARQWRCVVTFEDGTVLTSDAATTTLGIEITPAEPETAVGSLVTLKVSSPAGAQAYQWQHSKDGVRWNNTKWTGYDTDTLSFKMLAALDSRQWRCVVTLADGSTAISEVATTYLPVAK